MIQVMLVSVSYAIHQKTISSTKQVNSVSCVLSATVWTVLALLPVLNATKQLGTTSM